MYALFSAQQTIIRKFADYTDVILRITRVAVSFLRIDNGEFEFDHLMNMEDKMEVTFMPLIFLSIFLKLIMYILQRIF